MECNSSGLSVAMWCRKSFLFGNKKSGAQGSAVVCNIIETAKDNNLDPYKYVTYIFTRFLNLEEDETVDILIIWNALAKFNAKNLRD